MSGSGVGLAQASVLRALGVVTCAAGVGTDAGHLLRERVAELGEFSNRGLDVGGVAPRGEGRCNRTYPYDTDDHPYGHGGMLLRGCSTDQGHQLVEPAVVGQEDMQVEQVVGCEDGAAGSFGKLGGPLPELVRGPCGHEQVDDPRAGCAVHRLIADRAPETVGARCGLVGADTDGQVVDLELHVATRRALGSDCRHQDPPPRRRGPLLTRNFGTPGNALESDCGSGGRAGVTEGTKLVVQRFGKDGLVRPITFAHRGGRADGPENTLPAFRRALEHGATGLESDARLSVDGEVVLVHDAIAKRGSFRRARVDQSTAAELEALDVPRLADLYADLGTDYELSLDLYDPAARVPVLDVATAAGATDLLWVCAGGIETLVELGSRGTGAHLVHSTRRQKITGSVERHAARLAEQGIDAVNMHYTDWTKGLVELYHRFEVLTFAWDIQEVRHLRAVLAMGMDAVYSDYVDRMVATVAEWSE